MILSLYNYSRAILDLCNTDLWISTFLQIMSICIMHEVHAQQGLVTRN